MSERPTLFTGPMVRAILNGQKTMTSGDSDPARLHRRDRCAGGGGKDVVVVNYYNDIDPYCCEWLRNLIDAGEIPPGVVDDRSIQDVRPEDLDGFTQCHFFAGIGGWSLALRLAGWPADVPVWTGSCPCQPFSSAGKGLGKADPRHLWPDFFRLIRECRPPILFGEQVASAIRHGWLDGVCTDLEVAGYACGAAVLGAHSVGAPHIRQRLYWVAKSNGGGQKGARGSRTRSVCACGIGSFGGLVDSTRRRLGIDGGAPGNAGHTAQPDATLRLVDPDITGLQPGCGTTEAAGYWDSAESAGGRLGDASEPGLPLPQQPELSGAEQLDQGRATEQPGGAWDSYHLVHCRDGKTRRVGAGIQCLAHGIPRSMGPSLAGIRGMVRSARRNRVGRLKGFGNSIVPQVAAEFIRAVLEVR